VFARARACMSTCMCACIILSVSAYMCINIEQPGSFCTFRTGNEKSHDFGRAHKREYKKLCCYTCYFNIISTSTRIMRHTICTYTYKYPRGNMSDIFVCVCLYACICVRCVRVRFCVRVSAYPCECVSVRVRIRASVSVCCVGYLQNQSDDWDPPLSVKSCRFSRI